MTFPCAVTRLLTVLSPPTGGTLSRQAVRVPTRCYGTSLFRFTFTASGTVCCGISSIDTPLARRTAEDFHFAEVQSAYPNSSGIFPANDHIPASSGSRPSTVVTWDCVLKPASVYFPAYFIVVIGTWLLFIRNEDPGV